jgi:hypothetical protein
VLDRAERRKEEVELSGGALKNERETASASAIATSPDWAPAAVRALEVLLAKGAPIPDRGSEKIDVKFQ